MKNKHAFTLVEIMRVVSIIALLAAVGIPSFLNSRQGTDNNMKEINISSVNAAKDQWAILNNEATGVSRKYNSDSLQRDEASITVRTTSVSSEL